MRFHFAAIRRQIVLGPAILACGFAIALFAGSAAAAGCPIDGPTVAEANRSFTLCGEPGSGYTYEWHGQGVSTSSTSRCVTVSGRRPGTYEYELVVRRGGIEIDRCAHVVTVGGVGGGGTAENCVISGPESIGSGEAAELCSQSFTNATYSWTGPGSFRSSLRCIRVTTPGVYRLVIRNRSTGFVRECSFVVDDAEGGYDDPDAISSDNCPRALPFWQQQCQRASAGRRQNPNDFTLQELRAIARRVDEGSTHFNWSDDLAGLCAALNPSPPMTNRKQVTRHYAAMLANVAAGELDLTTRSGESVRLDPSTPGSFRSAGTVGELMALAERMLRSGRGSFVQLRQQLNAVNSGRGIGPVCQ